MTRSFSQSQKRTHGSIIPLRSKRTSGGMVKDGKHDDLHGEGLFSIAKNIFKRGKKAVDMAKKFSKSDLAKKAISAGKTAIKVGQTAADLYGSETGQAIKQMLLPSDTPGFPGEKHAILDRGGGRGYVGANYMGPGTQVAKRLKRGDVGITPVDMLAMKHDVAYRKAQGAKSKAQQLRMIRKADEDMVAGLKKIVELGADNPMNIKQAQLIIAKLGAEKAGLIAEGSFGGELETISTDEMNLLNKADTGLEMMGYGEKSHPALKLKQKLAKQYGKGLKLAGQRGKGLKLAGSGQCGGNIRGHFDPVGYAQEIMMKGKIQSATAYANDEGKKGKNWKAAFARYMKGEMPSFGPVVIPKRKQKGGRRNLLPPPPPFQKLYKAYKGKQSGGFVFTIAGIIAAASSAAAAAAAAAPTVTAIAGAVGATAGAAVAVKELAGGSLKTVIAKKIKEEAKLTKVKSTDLPKSIVKVADKKLQAIKKLDAPVKVKKEMVVKQIVKPLIPLVKKKYAEKLGKRLKGSGLKLAGQRGKGLKLAGGAISDADILKKMM